MALAGEGGRAVRFPGQDLLRGRLTVAEVPAAGAVQRVESLGTAAWPEIVVDARDFVRAVRRGGALVPDVTPAAGGTVIPMELEHQRRLRLLTRGRVPGGSSGSTGQGGFTRNYAKPAMPRGV